MNEKEPCVACEKEARNFTAGCEHTCGRLVTPQEKDPIIGVDIGSKDGNTFVFGHKEGDVLHITSVEHVEKEPWEKKARQIFANEQIEQRFINMFMEYIQSLLDAERAELMNQIESALEDYCISGMPVLDHKMMMGYIRASLRDTVIEKIKNK
jgi:hypothetical protein